MDGPGCGRWEEAVHDLSEGVGYDDAELSSSEVGWVGLQSKAF